MKYSSSCFYLMINVWFGVCPAGSHVSRSRLWWKHGLASWIMSGKERNYTATVACFWTLKAFRKASLAKVWENGLNRDRVGNPYRFPDHNFYYSFVFFNSSFKELAHKSNLYYSFVFFNHSFEEIKRSVSSGRSESSSHQLIHIYRDATPITAPIYKIL